MAAAAGIPAVISAIGAVATGVSTFMSAQANANAAKAEAQQAEQAARAQAEGERRRSDQVRSRQRALIGASGVAATGSPLEIMLDTAKEAELQAQQTITQGKNTAMMKRYEAKAYQAQGIGGLVGGAFNAGGGILGGLYKNYKGANP